MSHRQGRPTVTRDEPSTDVHLTVSVSLYDRVYAIAIHERRSVPDVIRRVLVKDLETQTRHHPIPDEY
jgi:hypothetical protein